MFTQYRLDGCKCKNLEISEYLISFSANRSIECLGGGVEVVFRECLIHY